MVNSAEGRVFVSDHPVVKDKLAKLRSIDNTARDFRQLVRELSVLLAYEATNDLQTDKVTVETPMGQATGERLRGTIGLVPILRAGLGMVEGFSEMMPDAVVWHIGLKRDERTLEPMHYYANKPLEPDVQTGVILDPMLATGGSASAACDLLKSWGIGHIRFVGLIAAPEGIERLHVDHPEVPIYLAGLDAHLNEDGFIVPGLGDAGDRQFGTA